MGMPGCRLAAALVALAAVAAPVHAAPALTQLGDAARALGASEAPPAAPAAAPVAVESAGNPLNVAPRVQPDLAITPGKLCTTDDSDFKELRYPEQIAYCQRHVTQAMKKQVAASYGVPEAEWGNYEFDHLIPLAIGGNSHVDNLWPQPKGDDNSDGKDKLELSLYYQMKAGQITQAEAVRQIYAWFNKTGLPKLRAQLAAKGLAAADAPKTAD